MTTNSVTLELTNKKNSGVTISIFNLAHELARGWIISEEQLDAVDKLLDAVATDDSVTITITRNATADPQPAPVTVAPRVKLTKAQREALEAVRDGKVSRHWASINYVRSGLPNKPNMTITKATMHKLLELDLVRETTQRNDWHNVVITEAGIAALGGQQ